MNVLIIEDDPMVEFIHRNYLEKLTLFQNIYSANTFEDARSSLEQQTVHLILLDIHLKDSNGLTILQWIRDCAYKVEVIVISAANERAIIQQSLHFGILDYLIKPFTFERFQQSIELYTKQQLQYNQSTFNQSEIDQMIFQGDMPPKIDTISEKGITNSTYHHILSIIKDLDRPFSIQDIVELSGFSHVSVRKYIAYLEEQALIKSEIVYVKVGRPYRIYRYAS